MQRTGSFSRGMICVVVCVCAFFSGVVEEMGEAGLSLSDSGSSDCVFDVQLKSFSVAQPGSGAQSHPGLL